MTPPFVMNHVFELFFPSVCRCGDPLPEDFTDAIFQESCKKMSDWFGGGQVIPAREGFYTSDETGYMPETNKVIFSNANAQRFIAHKKDFRDYCLELANRLSQHSIGMRIDGKMEYLYSTEKICVHKKETTAQPEAVRETERKQIDKRKTLLSALERLSDETSARDLVNNIWHYSASDEEISIDSWPEARKNLLFNGTPPKILADQNGFQIILICLNTERLKTSEIRSIAEQIQLSKRVWYGLFLFTTPSGKEWNLVNSNLKNPIDPNSGLLLRRLLIRADVSLVYLVRILESLDLEEIGSNTNPGYIHEIHNKIFNVSSLSDAFFKTYGEVFKSVVAQIQGFNQDLENEKYIFAQILFNRLMFLAFVQKKGWLKINESIDYLDAIWKDYQTSRATDSNFYNDRLKILFFEGLNTPKDERPPIENLVGSVPYLNGGLFAKNSYDENFGIIVPDQSIQLILHHLFAKYNFTVEENTELDQEIAVDPEMLGHVFEELVIGRHEQGSYYTPKDVVSYMCREALISYLCSALPEESPDAIQEFVERRDTSALLDCEAVFEALNVMKVCDPACGSGAYLLGMLQELKVLRASLFNSDFQDQKRAFQRRMKIIQNNIYGVDLDPFAVNIARLRLWLALAVEYDSDDPLPMPNLDFKIEVGDSLTAPSPEPQKGQLHLYRSHLIRFADELQQLRFRYMTSSEATRAELQKVITEVESKAREELSTSFVLPKDAFDWRIRFAEVFIDGGFDIILANPPYVKAGSFFMDRRAMKQVYGAHFDGRSDLYIYFYYRALQLLKNNGTLVFISSNKWVQAGFGDKLRKELLNKTEISSIVDFGSEYVFKGIAASPLIITAKKSTNKPDTLLYTRVNDLKPPYPNIRAIVQNNGMNLDYSVLKNETWDLMLPETRSQIQQMAKDRQTLGDFLRERNLEIQCGIKTGLNEAYYLTQEERDELIAQDPRSADLIFPFLRGKDSGRWKPNYANMWMIVTPNPTERARMGLAPIEIEQYPAICLHLQKYKVGLEKRGDKGEIWWNLRKCAYYNIFSQPKIFYQEIATYPGFSLDTSGLYSNNKVFIIPTGDLFLLGILNSSAAWKFLKAVCPVLKDDTFSLQIPNLLRLPIPEATEAQKAGIISLVQRCIAEAKTIPPKPMPQTPLEQELDSDVAKLYGLSL